MDLSAVKGNAEEKKRVRDGIIRNKNFNSSLLVKIGRKDLGAAQALIEDVGRVLREVEDDITRETDGDAKAQLEATRNRLKQGIAQYVHSTPARTLGLTIPTQPGSELANPNPPPRRGGGRRNQGGDTGDGVGDGGDEGEEGDGTNPPTGGGTPANPRPPAAP